MNVICADGTSLQCAAFEAIDSGVLLYESEPSEDEDEELRATGFVPITHLRYVLPEGISPGPQPGQQVTQPRPETRPRQPTGAAGPGRQQSPPSGSSGSSRPTGTGRQR